MTDLGSHAAVREQIATDPECIADGHRTRICSMDAKLSLTLEELDVLARVVRSLLPH